VEAAGLSSLRAEGEAIQYGDNPRRWIASALSRLAMTMPDDAVIALDCFALTGSQ
jgi:hypothetical protein